MSIKRPEKRIFISSTIRDLEEQRAFVRSIFESYSKIRLRCISSEKPDFPLGPNASQIDRYSAVLQVLSKCDFVVQLLDRNYGVPDIQDGSELISITHKEYRTAYNARIPVFPFASRHLWVAYSAFKAGVSENDDGVDERLFSLLDEIEGNRRRHWMFRFKDNKDIEEAIKANIFEYDDSEFVGDIKMADGDIIKVGKIFEKEWELENTGMLTWEDRFLKEVNPGNGLVPESGIVPIKKTEPGETVRISVKFKAPKYPGTCRSLWKMVTKGGAKCFPWKRGIWCLVTIVEGKDYR